MKYMLMMHASGAGWKDAGIGTWPPEDIRAHIGFMKRFAEAPSVRRAGGGGLAGPEEARIVRATSGVPEVTDGPFAESKEFLAGYWIVDVDSPNQAYAMRRGHRQRLAVAEVPINIPIEVREVMSAHLPDVTIEPEPFPGERLLRDLAPQVLGAVMRRFGVRRRRRRGPGGVDRRRATVAGRRRSGQPAAG